MTVPDAAEIAQMVGARLAKEPTGFRDAKALVIVVAAVSWTAAADLADALGISPDDQEAIHESTARYRDQDPP